MGVTQIEELSQETAAELLAAIKSGAPEVDPSSIESLANAYAVVMAAVPRGEAEGHTEGRMSNMR